MKLDSSKTRLWLYLAAWVVALIATGIWLAPEFDSTLVLPLLIPSFPVGLTMGIFLLLSHVSPKLAEVVIGPGAGLSVSLSYLLYIIHAVLSFRFSHKYPFPVMYVILIIMLAVNVAGCGFLRGFHPN